MSGTVLDLRFRFWQPQDDRPRLAPAETGLIMGCCAYNVVPESWRRCVTYGGQEYVLSPNVQKRETFMLDGKQHLLAAGAGALHLFVLN